MKRLLVTVMMLAVAQCAFAGDTLRTLDEVAATLERQDVSGKVVDSDGKPVDGAEIFVHYARGEDGMRDRLTGRGTTDAKGKFLIEKAIVWEPVTEITGYRGSTYVVFASHPKLGINFATLTAGSPTDEVRIKLSGIHKLTPTVVDQTGKPVAGARVSLYLCETTETYNTMIRLQRDFGISSGVTGKDGKVTLAMAGRSTFYAEKDGYARGVQREMSDTIVLSPSAKVSGLLTDPNGKPVTGAAVFYRYLSKSGRPSGLAITDADGRFRIENAPCAGYRYAWVKPDTDAVGTMTLQADDLRVGSPYIADPVSFKLNPGESVEKNIRLKRGIVVSGRFVDLNTSQPIDRMRVEVIAGRTRVSDRITGKDGEFSIKCKPGTELTVVTQRASDGRNILDRDWMWMGNWECFNGPLSQDVTGMTWKIKRWQTSPMRGRVVDAQGRGVADARIYIETNVPPVYSDDDGNFKLAGPDDRDFELYAITADEKLAVIKKFKAGSKDVELPLVATRPFKGQVVDTLGAPGEALKFDVHPLVNGQPLASKEVAAAPDGTFTTPPLCPGLTLEARWEYDQECNISYMTAHRYISLLDEPIRLVASRYNNALIGKVVDVNGNPISGATFDVQPYRAERRGNDDKKNPSGKDGSFTLLHLAEGDVTVIASAKGYKSRAVLTPSSAIDCRIVLRPTTAPTTCKVTVVDENRKPVAGAPVTMWIKTSSAAMTTDAEGVCEFQHDSIDAKHKHLGLVGVDVEGKAWAFSGMDPTRDEDILLIAHPVTNRNNGQIVDIDGKPVAGARVRLTSIYTGYMKRQPYAEAKVGEFLDFSIKTDADGRYEWPRLDSEEAAMDVTAPGFAKRTVARWSESIDEARYLLLPCGRLTGRLKLGDKPIVEGTVYLASEIDRLNESGTPCDIAADGTFVAENLMPSRYRVKSIVSGGTHYVASSSDQIKVESGETANSEIACEEAILLKGRLIDVKSGHPIPNSWMVVHRDGGFDGTDGTTTDVEGRFEFYLPAGVYEFSYMTERRYMPGGIESVKIEKKDDGIEREFKVEAEEKR